MTDLAPVYAELRQKNGMPLFFGAVQTKKSYVAFHLMLGYVRPELLASVSHALKATMQGKSCSRSSPP